MKVAIASQALEAGEATRQLLSPWKVTFTDLDEADISIVYGEKPPENMETIIIPSDSPNFVGWLEDEGLGVGRKLAQDMFVAATAQTNLLMTPQILYQFNGSLESVSSISQPAPVRLDDETLLLTVDVIEEYGRVMNETLNPKMSTLYRFITGLPIPYTVAPEKLKNLLMGRNSQETSLNLCDKLPMDALRFLLARSLEETTGEKLTKKTWNGKHYACAMTHDVETRSGFERARSVKRLEEKYDLPSAWYIPSKHYKLDPETVETLGNCGEIGAHDTKHDGKLRSLKEQELLKRLREAKQALEEIVSQPVVGFRAPLLQHSQDILGGLKEAGYIYDTSIPTWEPKHPQTMRSHGIGTTYPTYIDGMIEIPVSVVQDHQLLCTLGLKPKEAITKWLSMMTVIKELGGCCVLLSHPEYAFFDINNLDAYEELLNTIKSQRHVLLATPKQLADVAVSTHT